MKYFALLLTIFALVSSAVARGKAICELDHSVIGYCRGSMDSWSYNADTNECVYFVYGGCGGNKNRFETKNHCESVCKK